MVTWNKFAFAVSRKRDVSNRHSVSLVQITGTSAVVKDWIVACVAVSVFAVILVLFCTLKKRRRARKERYNCKFVIKLDLKGIDGFKNQLSFAKTSGIVTRDREKTIAGPHVPNDNPRNNCGTHFGSSSSSGASFFAWRRRARNASDWWWTARNDGKGTDGGRSPLSPSRPPLRAHRKRDVWVWGSFGSISFSFLKWRISLRISHFKVPLKTGCAVLCRIAHWDYFGTFLLHSLVITKLRGNRVQNSAPKQ